MAPESNPAVTSFAREPRPRSNGPRLFAQSDYICAVRASDGAILSHGVAAAPYDVLEIYGAGFGRAVADSPDTNGPEVTVTIGGTPADVRFAGRVAPGLYQFDVTVPAGLAAGDHPVVATVGGVTTESPALLKIAKAADAAGQAEGRYASFLRNASEASALAADAECSLAFGT